MKHLTMQKLEDLGFEIVESYKHDEYVTQRRKKGCITIETTFELKSGNFVSQDLTIDEQFIDGFTEFDLKNLDKILNKNQIK